MEGGLRKCCSDEDAQNHFLTTIYDTYYDPYYSDLMCAEAGDRIDHPGGLYAADLGLFELTSRVVR
jgi:hypothetical protein